MLATCYFKHLVSLKTGIPDAGIFQKGETIYPLRFMSGNPNISENHILSMLDYIRMIGDNNNAEGVQ